MDYGPIRVLMPAGRTACLPDVLAHHLRDGLSCLKAGDYILPVGDPMLMGLAIAIALEMHGKINVLSYNRDSDAYDSYPLTK